MLVSWVLLLLGWVLLLGQPVCGTHEEYSEDELFWEGLEEPFWEDLEEPQAFWEDLEDLEEETPELQPLEEPEETLLDSEELLQMEANQEAQLLEEHGEFHPLMDIFKKEALEYYNKQHPGPLYRHLEDADLQIEKAIGTIISFTMFLVNTNCTKEEGRTRERSLPYFDFLRHFDSQEDEAPQDLKRCRPPPESEQEKLKCWFTIFLDGRHRTPAVIDHYCRPVNILDDPESMLEDAAEHL